MLRVWWKRGFVVSCLFVLVGQDAISQQAILKPFRLRQSARTSFSLAFGVTSPQGRDGLREFWIGGPNGSATFHVKLNQVVSVGIGTDLSLLYFDEGAFAQRWPGVTLKEKKNLFVGNVYLDATCSFLPANKTRPYLSTQVGAQFISEALYREVIAGVRHTYYDVGGKPRLAFGVAAGATISLNHAFGMLVELKGRFIHNDPNVSFLVHGRAGILYNL